MLRRYRLLLTAAVIAVTVTSLRTLAQPESGQSQNLDLAASTAPIAEISWKTALGTAITTSSWNIASCGDTAPLFCVYANRELVENLPLHPSDRQSETQEELGETAVSPKRQTDYHSLTQTTRMLTTLKAWLGGYSGFFQTDRPSEPAIAIAVLGQH
ncbi:MAG: hypothetical protein HC769_01205 [Cyanobacteria bacterium CRU_2_1]|nr:hypothetical protein [Cyanobacteria bacterium RU_5_0]NJR57584.1 hypothetical protein [Cyanobacteria bacterium CRU_2_1]